MSFVGGMLGIGGGNQGASFHAQQADILQPANVGQANEAYGQANSGINQQQAFLNALQAQNGIGNQANVFQQQQGLANQLQGIANGTGPNPAMAQLNNATGANIANQAALMAGQRGAGSNVGLLARQAAMQGGNIQQQAVGQGAQLQANQSLNALGSLQGQQANMANLAGAQVGQQANALTGYNQAAQSEQGNLLGALSNYNNAKVNMQSNANTSNSGIAQTNAQGQQAMLGGALGGIGAAAHFLNRGGVVKNYADGGAVNGPSSFAGKFLSGWSGGQQAMTGNSVFSGMGGDNQGAQALNRGMNQFGAGLGEGIHSLMSSPAPTPMMPSPTSGNQLGHPSEFQSGGSVSGKASQKGDSLKNDTVPAFLSPGEIVLPRHITQSGNAPEKAKQFVEAIMAKQGMRKKA